MQSEDSDASAGRAVGISFARRRPWMGVPVHKADARWLSCVERLTGCPPDYRPGNPRASGAAGESSARAATSVAPYIARAAGGNGRAAAACPCDHPQPVYRPLLREGKSAPLRTAEPRAGRRQNTALRFMEAQCNARYAELKLVSTVRSLVGIWTFGEPSERPDRPALRSLWRSLSCNRMPRIAAEVCAQS